MERYVAAGISPSNDAMNPNPMKVSNHHNGTSSSSLRELDELLMGGNDLDAIPFEFGCDYFGPVFEDKYAAPASQVACSATSSSAPSIMATITDSAIDPLPSLFASLLSPSLNLHVGMPSPSFPAHNEQQDRAKSIRLSMNGHNFFHHPLKRACDAAFPSQVSQVESREKSAKDKTQSVTGNTLPASSVASSTHIGRWTKKEHESFLEGLKLYGKSWKKISSLVITRTLVQIRTHTQKYLQKQSKNAQKAAAAAAATTSSSSSSAFTNSSKARQQQRCGTQKQNDEHLDAWKGQQGLVPISFPDILLASSSSSSSSSTYTPSSSVYSRSPPPYILPAIVKESPNFGNNVCRLDQLLQDESHGSAVEGYYQSPIGSDDEILHPMYVGAGHWSRDETHAAVIVPSCSSMPLSSSSSHQFPNKRRRLDHLMPASSSNQLINPTEAMVSSSEAQPGMFGLDVLHHGIGTADFHHQPSHHSYNPETQFVDSEYIYSNRQLP